MGMQRTCAVVLAVCATALGCETGAFDATVDLFAAKTVVDHSANWEVTYNRFYKVVTAGGVRYQLLQCFSDAAEQAKAEAALPACTAADTVPCTKLTIPLTNVGVRGNEAVGFLEELGELGSVSAVASAAVSPCLQSKGPLALTAGTAAGFDAVFTTTSDSNANAIHVGSMHDEASPYAKAEWVEFFSLFYNKEGMANYVLSRVKVSYEATSHLAKAVGETKKLAWITGIDTAANTITFGNLAKYERLAADVDTELVLFGQTVSSGSSEYVSKMKEADAVLVAITAGNTGMRWTDAGLLLEALGIQVWEQSQYKFLNASNAADYHLYQIDKFVSSGTPAMGKLGNDWEEHAFVAPDLLLSDIVKATRAGAAPWVGAPWVYLRTTAYHPISVAPDAAACGKLGGSRPSSIKRVRVVVTSGLKQADENPTSGLAAGAYAANMDYFPSKGDPIHAEDFDIEYHQTWKLVRNTFSGEAYVLLLKGVPDSALPSAYVLPAAKRFRIPVESVGYASTPTSALLQVLGQMNTIKLGDTSPDNCILRGIEVGEINGPISAYSGSGVLGPLIAGLDVYYGENSHRDLGPNTVFVSVSHDPGALNRAEWVFFVGAFHNAEARAKAVFDEMHENYLCVKEKGREASRVARKSPSAAFISGKWNAPGVYQASITAYLKDFIVAAGGTHAAGESTHPFTQAGTIDFSSVRFDSTAELIAAMQHVDVMIDNSYFSTANSNNPVTMADFHEFYGTTDAMLADVPFYKNKALYRIDKRQAANGYTDQFTRMYTEPDAVVEDFMTALHPGWKSSRATIFLRNLMTDPVIDGAAPELCEEYLAAHTPLSERNEACTSPCTERKSQEYCSVGCFWVNGRNECISVCPRASPGAARPCSLSQTFFRGRQSRGAARPREAEPSSGCSAHQSSPQGS